MQAASAGETVSPEQLALVTEDGKALAPVQPAGVQALFEMAIRGDAEVAVLEKLMDLQERVETRNARRVFFDELAAFQRECPEIPKSKTASIKSQRTGTEFGYKYAPLDAIARVVRDPLENHGFSYSFSARMADGFLNVRCTLRHIDGHQTSSTFPVPIDGGARMSAAQSHGAALTYGKRQALVAVLGLSTTEDDIDAPRGITHTEPIGQEQLARLSARIDEVKALRPRFSEAKYLKYLKVDQLSDLLLVDFEKAMQALEDAVR